MKLYTYSGETTAEALKLAQSEHGHNALVVKAKEIRKKTLTEPGLYEVVVAVDQEGPPKTNNMQERLDNVRQPPPKPKPDEGVQVDLSEAIREMRKLAGVDQNAPIKPATLNASKELTKIAQDSLRDAQKQQPEIPKEKERDKNEGAALHSLKGELSKINDNLKLIQNMVWSEEKEQGLLIPHEFAEIYRLAKNSGMHKAHLDEIMRLSLELMPVKMRENSVTVKRYFREVLRKMIYCRHEGLDLNCKKIVMLVGPTGVGKTTTLAKLAARYSKMLDKKYKVGILTLDTYRIGAVEQLVWYAKKMKISIETVMDAQDFNKEMQALEYCDVVLIDTTGHSQHDSKKIENLKKFTENGYKIDTALVLSLTTKYEDLTDIYNAFSPLEIDSLIFTKLDESRGFGNLFSLVYESKKPISYLSIGQEVPMDLLVASNDYLVDCMLDGFTHPGRKQT
ncbi:flagellar biosynthesis protein FlhF [Helicobacter ailurogastricus]|uniref:Flagellar biosynthesis protein FlhF n=1 Tax=Helicobacter ailurogastricus TaxID=1578720 RepID=A0A0K2XBE6_9HELI|nr:flagellar biosynthesis protein FlhF [Helicobacter ailurogastricus]GMB91820.1 Flagellar biosynthesis regulator FlhF [Helicobacter ailurogastricus]CRF41674.1 Flagellar biosynthesis protein FlhF [Helicobacter ailurogastricus]CRF42665.1 Flagellar biosynthesis protein FlhF [Helicobacter ailurogastricus]CRF43837.1 Flagellar biosynthesis protein FlhF [Helicobacter ailurogastricus]